MSQPLQLEMSDEAMISDTPGRDQAPSQQSTLTDPSQNELATPIQRAKKPMAPVSSDRRRLHQRSSPGGQATGRLNPRKKLSRSNIPQLTPPLTRGRATAKGGPGPKEASTSRSSHSQPREKKDTKKTTQLIARPTPRGEPNQGHNTTTPSHQSEAPQLMHAPTAPYTKTHPEHTHQLHNSPRDSSTTLPMQSSSSVSTLEATNGTDEEGECSVFPNPCRFGMLCNKQHNYHKAELHHVAAYLDSILMITRTTSLQLEEMRETCKGLDRKMDSIHKKLDFITDSFNVKTGPRS
ncbi:MAG: hypothetical protein FuLiV1_gp4 [Hangzhou acrida cinerea lispivirus 1]|uniref:Uncharacterized protein n=1 Tax=Hangzhou acrida cinerea lispivirus 1 TaxID=2905565 RepID=A0A8K1XBB4_9MONO|nr:MAG: hypothetical protein QKV03_gp4 [Hangzhou acrida cinerea lispivirus 1]UHK03317.1 MAG: hypothetical protein FuLiV1_gp4 [Hangzhou acrida cinerea lispivirus 1]